MVSIASCCGHTPKWRRAAERCRKSGMDSIKIGPEEGDGGISPRISEIVVDLPAPLGPRRANTSFGGMEKVRLSTAVVLVDEKDLVRWETWRPEWDSGSEEVESGRSRCSVETVLCGRFERRRAAMDEMEWES